MEIPDVYLYTLGCLNTIGQIKNPTEVGLNIKGGT
jgi:hypothetical protein